MKTSLIIGHNMVHAAMGAGITKVLANRIIANEPAPVPLPLAVLPLEALTRLSIKKINALSQQLRYDERFTPIATFPPSKSSADLSAMAKAQAKRERKLARLPQNSQ